MKSPFDTTTRLHFSWMRLFCLAELLLLAHSGLGSAEEMTEDTRDMDKVQDRNIKLQIAQNVADNNLNELHHNHLKEFDLIKRAPMGFTGVRGKKDEDSDLFDWPHADYDHVYDNNALDERWKKAANTFYGVRGKKYDQYDDLPILLDKQVQHSERDELLQDFINRWVAAKYLEQQQQLLQRQNILDNNKRTPFGFTGMRGKRYMDATVLNDAKRAFNRAFMGVRGKKDAFDDRQYYKRSLIAELPDVIGRKRFANKFVAVRGKKDHRNYFDSRERFFFNMWPKFSATSLSGKRAPNGFVGMRGKRESDIGRQTMMAQ